MNRNRDCGLKIDGAVITLGDIDGSKKRNAGKAPNRAKQISPGK